MFKESITTEELVSLPLKTFEGEIVLVENQHMVKIALEYLNRFEVLGFDTETKPAFKKGENHKVALLQLSTSERAFLFRMQRIGMPEGLKKLLSDPEIIKAGVAIRDDIIALQKVTRFKPGGFIELQDHAKNSGILNFSLKKLCAILCGFRISKSQQLTNWEADELTPQQMVYAATDAWTSLLIYEKLFYTNGE
jgi:ribonuclease D